MGDNVSQELGFGRLKDNEEDFNMNWGDDPKKKEVCTIHPTFENQLFWEDRLVEREKHKDEIY